MIPISVLILASDPLVRAGISGLLADSERCKVSGQESSDNDVEELLNLYQPDVVVWDLGWEMSDDDFTDIVSILEEIIATDQRIVVLLPEPEEEPTWVQTLLALGISGILSRQINLAQLESAIIAVDAGLLVFGSDAQVSFTPLESGVETAMIEPLTAREEEVLQVLAEGLSNRAIVVALMISEHTVKFHVNALMGKLDAHSRTEAVVKATRLGLIRL